MPPIPEPNSTPSVLFPRMADAPHTEGQPVPDYFTDLRLDRIVETILAGRQEYDLADYFRMRLTDLETVLFRQEVMRDVEASCVRRAIDTFAERMRTVRQRLAKAEKFRNEFERQGWFLSAALSYAEAVEQLEGQLGNCDLKSRGMKAFRDYLAEYMKAREFHEFAASARELDRRLRSIRYRLRIHGASVTVALGDGEPDFSAAVEATFRKFQQGATQCPRSPAGESRELNHLEGQILDRVALLRPDEFSQLAAFRERHSEFRDATIVRFDREIQFHAACLDYAEWFRRAGLAFCQPTVSDRSKQVAAVDTFDPALAEVLLRAGEKPVCNSFELRGLERVIVVTGPNQGGKTTFARAFGQLHHLAALGCVVPGREARLFLADQLYSVFEQPEDLASLRGKLEDELEHVHAILTRATPASVLVLNEVLASTTVEDAVFLGREALSRVIKLDLLCICVTFLDELSTGNAKLVSMVAGVDPEDPAVRTFKIERRVADGLAYAVAIAKHHRLTYPQLRQRMLG